VRRASIERVSRSSHHTVRVVAAVMAAILVAGMGWALGSAVVGGGRVEAARVAGEICLPGSEPRHLDTLFDTEPGGVVGADYQRAIELPTGDVLWTYQDAHVRRPDNSVALVHSIGVVQTGSCFRILMNGTVADPLPWLFPAATVPMSHWFWPLDATVGADGLVYVFAAEMVEHGDHYLANPVPTSTVMVGFDVDTWEVEYQGKPNNAGAQLYGWSIESDHAWTYLYANCHRQFGFDPFFDVAAHDRSCAHIVTVARVPVGQVFAPPKYWTGSRWSSNAAAAAPVIDTVNRMANGTDISRHNNHWIAITKDADWFGEQIFVERADRATGPFVRIATLTPAPKCRDCNTYYASSIPVGRDDVITIGLSNNRWDGAFSTVYRPSYLTVSAPAYKISSADRCSLGYCGW
jgi:hypothetical protein